MRASAAAGTPMTEIAQRSAPHARRIRDAALQIGLVVVVGGLAYGAAINAAQNLTQAHIASGFGFWNNTAGFDISQTLIPYSPSTSTFGDAFWVGLLNTLLVASIAVVFATVLGFIVGIARLSRNWLVAHLAAGYVELFRNIPLLLQILFWYNAVLKSLPQLRGSVALPGGAMLNNRGLFLPQPEFAASFRYVVIALVVGIAAAVIFAALARRRRDRTGKQTPILWPALNLILGPPIILTLLTDFPIRFSYPEVGRFNVMGGVEILPEFVALLFALTVYTAAFIAEVVRAGVLAVPHGQTEAAQALGLPAGRTLRLVVVPQAMRVIVPPLTSQYLNLIKNSSLAVAIGYPDLFQVFTGSVLNITGQAVEIVAITMAVYLTISLAISLLMNLYGYRLNVVER